MAWFHSTLSGEYGLDVEQIPLSPRHAHSSADRGIARLNKFFRRLMRLTYLRGAQQFTEALKLATDPSLTGPRRLLKNISVKHCHFKPHDYITTPQLATCTYDTTADGANESIGVMKVGHIVHLPESPGVVVVRRYANTSMSESKNPALLFDLLRRSPAEQMCVPCSNIEVLTFTCFVSPHTC
jgi:hypothetical protein